MHAYVRTQVYTHVDTHVYTHVYVHVYTQFALLRFDGRSYSLIGYRSYSCRATSTNALRRWALA